MTSKSLFFKMMKENTKQRLWIVALITLSFFFAFPIQTALAINGYLGAENLDSRYEAAYALQLARENLAKHFRSWCAVDNGILMGVFIILAVVCGLSGFSYLHSRKKTDFYHSLPIRREMLFFVVLVNGFLYTAVPYLVCLLLSAVMLQVMSVEVLWGQLFVNFLIHMAFYFLLYVTAVTAAIMTGNIVISVLGTLVFFLWGPLVTGICESYFGIYFKTWYDNGKNMEWWLTHTSPASWYLSAAGSETPGRMALWAVAAGAVIMGISVFLYRKRPSEAAGRAMAFALSQPVIKFLLVVPFGLLGGQVFYATTHRDAWAVFGLVCGLLISGCVIEIIYHFDFKKMLAHKGQLLVSAAFTGAVFAFFRFDLGGFDSYLPSAGKVESAGIYCYSLEPNAINIYHVQPLFSSDTGWNLRWEYIREGDLAEKMHLSDTELVLEIASRGVADAAASRKVSLGGNWRLAYEYENANPEEQWGDVLVAYHLTSGKTVYRNYRMNLTSVADALDGVYDTEEYKETTYPILACVPEEIAGINYQEEGEFSHVALKTDEMKEKLLLTYQKELRELTAQTRRQENPVAALQFKTVKMQEIIDILRKQGGYYSDFNNYLYFPVYPSFTETISLLNQCGIGVGEILTGDTVEKIVLEYKGSSMEKMESGEEVTETSGLPEAISEEEWTYEDRRRHTVMITDKAQIREILASTWSASLNVSDSLNPIYRGVSVTAYVPVVSEEETDFGSEFSLDGENLEVGVDGKEYRSYRLKFDAAQVPEFVKEEFHLTEELMKVDSMKAY